MAQIHSHLVAAGLLVGLTTALTTPGFSQSSTKVGVLTCHTSVRFGLVLASRQRLRCQFSSDHGGSPEDYAGHIIHAGHDLSLSAQGIMVWGVLAPTNDWQHGARRPILAHQRQRGPGSRRGAQDPCRPITSISRPGTAFGSRREPCSRDRRPQASVGALSALGGNAIA
jgi:hypothetical protein